MKFSRGRIDDNYKLYNKSLLMWEELKSILKTEFKKTNLVGGYFGLIDSWCLLILQYSIVKKDQIRAIDCKIRPFFYDEFRDLLLYGFFNIYKIPQKIDQANSIIKKQKIFKYNNNFYDEKHIIKKLSLDKRFAELDLKLITKRLDKSINDERLLNIDEKILIFLNKYFDNYYSNKIKQFIINSIPQIYIQKRDELELFGFDEIYNKKINSFIRTSKGIVDDDLLKIFGAEILKNGGSLYSIVHGGNNDEIKHNSIYKIDETLSKENIKASDFIFPINLSRYIPKIHLLKKGIVIYLNSRRFQNSFLMGSDTIEDYPRYIDFIIQAISKLNNNSKRELIIMRHNDKKNVNLKELTLHLNKFQIFEINSIRKRIYRRLCIPNLQIATYPGSIIVESIYAGIPCILYFDPKKYELSNEMKEIYNDLIQAKVFHTTPDSLVKFIEKTKNFDKWWGDKKTKAAINSFVKIMKTCF